MVFLTVKLNAKKTRQADEKPFTLKKSGRRAVVKIIVEDDPEESDEKEDLLDVKISDLLIDEDLLDEEIVEEEILDEEVNEEDLADDLIDIK